MTSTKSRKTLLSLLLVLMALAMTLSAFAPVAAARSVDGDAMPVGADTRVYTAVDDFISALEPNGYHYIDAAGLNEQLSTVKPFVVDVRTPADYSAGHIPTAVNVPILTLLDNLDKLPAKDQPIVVYCGIGHNGAIAMMSLSLLGYTNVKSLGGGYTFWTEARPKLPVEQ
jgi:rhodanese-related sulfurtransferase